MLQSRSKSRSSAPDPTSDERRYDDYLYEEFPITETHPDRLAAIAQLFAMDVAPPERCRVLELGCGLGGNIVPMAFDFPESSFVGLDLAANQVAIGKESAKARGLRNIDLCAMNILDVGDDLGTFDYILCHGVYSWVPPEVSEKILQICSRNLSPRGIAYVSFNTFPGWHLRGAIRDMLRREVGEQGTPAERVARAREFLRLFEYLPTNGSPAQKWLKNEVEMLKRLSDQYLFYEHLVEINRPCYFSDFAAAAEKHRLRYVGDAHFPSMVPERLGADAAEAVAKRASNFLETEQYLDYLEVRYFRRALLCHDSVQVDRNVAWPRLDGLWVSSRFVPTSEQPDLKSTRSESFQRSSGNEIETPMPLLKAALVLLAEARPRGYEFRDLCSRARALLDEAPPRPPTEADLSALGGDVLGMFAMGQVELTKGSRDYVTTPGPQPATTTFIRHQAMRDLRACTNFRHESVRMDRFDRSLLRQLDGTRTWDELATGVIKDIHAGKVSLEVDGVPRSDRELVLEIIEQKLPRLARMALLTA